MLPALLTPIPLDGRRRDGSRTERIDSQRKACYSAKSSDSAGCPALWGDGFAEFEGCLCSLRMEKPFRDRYCAAWRRACALAATLGIAKQKHAGLISRGYNPRPFHHQNHRPLRRPGEMHDASRDNKSLARSELNDASTFEFDDPLALDDIKELVFVIMLVPMEVSFDDSQAYHAIIHMTQGLIPPGMVGPDDRRQVHHFERLESGIEMDGVGPLILHGLVTSHWDLQA
jgi:hypothetical protein